MFFRRALERRSTEYTEYSLNDPALLDFLGISPGEVNVYGKNALKEATVYACIKILAESLSKLPLKIYREDENGVNKAVKHYLYKLLKLRPNPYMSASDFAKCNETQRNIYGNAYVNIEMDEKGRIVGFWPIDASKVRIWIDDIGLFSSKNHIWYEVDVGTERRKLMPNELLHFKSGVTLDGIVGVPPLDYLRATVENAAAAGRFINNFYKQGLQVKGIVQYVGDLNPDAQKKFREKFEEMSSGLKNSHRIALMPIGYEFKPISLTMSDAQFLENTELTIRQIATAFGIKMHQLNDLSRATHTNVAEQQQQFYVDTLLPILTMYEQEMTYKLFLDSELDAGYYVKFNVDSILRADIKTRYEAYAIGIQNGFLEPDEARAKEDLPPRPGGNQLIVNGNYIPLTMVGQQYMKGGGDSGQSSTEGNKGNPGAASEN
ncbi:phage portal protein [Geobacillus stearothermophilus]|uniref:phage portal protein n=1 Tax=Geobacillus stearothermophilus TaxID=1422 RepID=UPI002E2106EF|nr:phage portal protein [Geobacillus stearothermophilus]MED3777996.1 phage portal protein [Geobacillus stearothermophilus]MED4830636.1 phage portal protein [Geobacillus stearothermophilus]MED4960318.1 phage portal protein [Geobacillus stearothermophilus]